MSADIAEAQRRTFPRAEPPRSRTDFRRVARWWALEAQRGYASSADSLRYAANMRWAAEMTETHGEGTWSELQARAKAGR